jgi:opacity protein-like surface antigen
MKKISFLVIIIFPILVNLNGQDNRFSIGLIGSLESNKYDFISTSLTENYDYEASIGYSCGIGAKYNLTEKLFLKSGLLLYSHGYSIKYNYVFMDEGDPLIPRQSDLRVTYFRIPLKVGFQVLNFGKFSFNPAVGLNTAFQISIYEKTTYEDNAQRESTILSADLNKTQLGINIDLGVEYELSQNMNLTIIPYLAKGLNKLDDNGMETGQISIGGKFGLYYRF